MQRKFLTQSTTQNPNHLHKNHIKMRLFSNMFENTMYLKDHVLSLPFGPYLKKKRSGLYN